MQRTVKQQHEPAYPYVVRKKWVFLIDHRGWSMRRVAREYLVSVKTVHKWYHRMQKPEGRYQTKKPQPALKLTPEIRQFIVQEKAKANPGPQKLAFMIHRTFGVSVSSTIVYRFLKRRGLIRKPQKKLPWYQPLKNPIIPTQAGALVQIDIKYVWRGGKRKYQRTFLDVYTGIPFAHISESKDDDTTIQAFLQAERYFPFPLTGVQTDNGGEFRGDFHRYLKTHGIHHFFIPKSSPQRNGSVERFHRTIDEEFYRNPNKEAFPTLASYLHWYRYERISLSHRLYGLTPQEKWLLSVLQKKGR